MHSPACISCQAEPMLHKTLSKSYCVFLSRSQRLSACEYQLANISVYVASTEVCINTVCIHRHLRYRAISAGKLMINLYRNVYVVRAVQQIISTRPRASLVAIFQLMLYNAGMLVLKIIAINADSAMPAATLPCISIRIPRWLWFHLLSGCLYMSHWWLSWRPCRS